MTGSKILTILTIFLISSLVAIGAQDEVGDADLDASYKSTAQQNIQEISIRNFENEGFWIPKMSRDNGLLAVQTQRSYGSENKEALEGALISYKDNPVAEDAFILGAKVQFFRRRISDIIIEAARPVPVEGVVKQVSIWVAGRNTTHTLKLMIRDRFNHKFEIYMGRLNFLGWKQLTAVIPPNVKQIDFHRSRAGTGILVEGLKIVTDLSDSYGMLYVYFDDMRAQTDLFAEDNQDLDDPVDNW